MTATAPDDTYLVETFLPLARAMARRWGGRCPHLRDDFESDALLALVLAARAYHPGPAGEIGSFAHFARQRIHWALGKVLKIDGRHPLSALPPLPDGTHPLDHLAGREPEVGEALETAEELATLFELAELPPRYREVLTRLVGGDERALDLAREQGCTANNVSQIRGKALKRLKAAAGVKS